mgnify:CR=1 FL=1
MLYGVIELGNLPDSLIARPYGGQAALCLIDASTGDFLVDTWHDSPSGNIRDFGNRQLGDEFTHEQLNSDVAEGRSGYVEIESQTVGEPLLLSYQPVNINEWRIALSVPESAVFERANNIRNILAGFMGALLALLRSSTSCGSRASCIATSRASSTASTCSTTSTTSRSRCSAPTSIPKR